MSSTIIRQLRRFLKIPLNESYQERFMVNIDINDPLSSLISSLSRNKQFEHDFWYFIPTKYAEGPIINLWENGIKQEGIDAGGGTKTFMDLFSKQIIDLGLFEKKGDVYIFPKEFKNRDKIPFHVLATMFGDADSNFVRNLIKNFPGVDWKDFTEVQDFMLYNFVSNIIIAWAEKK